jgi:gliding motility-associated lipoprotein GldD
MDTHAEPYWINLDFPMFSGTFHLSFKKINNNLNDYIEDSRTLVMKHIPKASAIENRLFENSFAHVYGLTYTISGVDAASPYQLYLTDSTRHFVRGALYFNTVPNNDSLAPVIEFLKEDINHLIETFEWREN